MTDNVAILDGFTQEVYGEYKAMGLHLLVKKDTDLSQRFKAWDMDCQEYITVNGWLTDFNLC